MAEIVYRQMPAPRDIPQKIPAPGQKLGCKSPRVGESFQCKSPGVRGGGWSWQKLITAKVENESVSYLFCYCRETRRLWQQLQKWFPDYGNLPHLEPQLIILGISFMNRLIHKRRHTVKVTLKGLGENIIATRNC